VAVIGWLFVVAIFLSLSMTWGALAVFNLGEYTIGGAHNSRTKKLVIIALGVVLLLGWWFVVVKHAPFTISFR
jgi:hypothetical protein